VWEIQIIPHHILHLVVCGVWNHKTCYFAEICASCIGMEITFGAILLRKMQKNG